MTLEIFPCRLEGLVSLPPSKSQAHRALFLACLSGEESFLSPWEESKDLLATRTGLEALGGFIRVEEEGVRVRGPLAARGENLPDPSFPLVIPLGESGTSLRFLIPQAMVMDRPVLFQGEGRLMDRPLEPYETLFSAKGLLFERKREGLFVRGPLEAGDFSLPGDISSQFLSGLLLTLPRLKGRSSLTVIKPLVSAPYLRMTLTMMEDFGITFDLQDREDRVIFYVDGPQEARSHSLALEGDWSNGAGLAIFNDIGGRVDLPQPDPSSLQGDRDYPDFFRVLVHGPGRVDLEDHPDLGPLLFSLAALKGGGYFTGTGRLKDKESSRALGMKEELSKFGIAVHLGEDWVRVEAGSLHAPKEPISSHGDHRLVMALVPLLTLTGGVLEGEEAVDKSFPSYFEKLETLSLNYRRL